MKELKELTFRRRFSFNAYKTLRLQLAEMSCAKDWTRPCHGDPYPVLKRTGAELQEYAGNGRYTVENQGQEACGIARLLGMHFPYATYEIGLTAEDGCAGLRLDMPALQEDESMRESVTVWVIAEIHAGLASVYGEKQIGQTPIRRVTLAERLPVPPEAKLLVTCRGSCLDLYWNEDPLPHPLGTWEVAELAPSFMYHCFIRMTAALELRLAPRQKISCTMSSYLDGGISQADIKCMRYENGQPVMRDGRLYLTLSARAEQGGYQAVVSWNPSACDFRLEGALFFDYGDDAWCADVASSVVYDRRTELWYIWACAFSHGHVLCHAASSADLCHGIHVLDAERMPAEHREVAEADEIGRQSGAQVGEHFEVSQDGSFYAKSGDEDPDLFYDEAQNRWLLAICRLVTLDNKRQGYRYFVFESQEPLRGFTLIGHTTAGESTGGSLIRFQGKIYLLCGANFDAVSRYQLHPIDQLERYDLLRFNYPDGGFRGWGTLIPVPCGNRTRYLHITFDRHGGSAWRWSYGNLYVFEADEMARTPERPMQRRAAERQDEPR